MFRSNNGHGRAWETGHWNGCDVDLHWFIVIDSNTDPSLGGCSWENHPQYPVFLYSPGPSVESIFNGGKNTLQWCHNEHNGDGVTGVSIVYSNVCSGGDQRKHQSSSSLAFVWEIHRWPVHSPQNWPVTRKMFPFDDVIMNYPGTRSCSPVSPTRLKIVRTYRNYSHISRTLVGNKIVDNSDVVGASPLGAAPTTSSFST